MYSDFYNLVEEPFPVTPDPKYFFLSDSHKEALAAIVYGVENRRGFVEVVGEVGTGKTTILRAYLAAIDRAIIRPIYVFDPQLTFLELVTLIAEELKLQVEKNEQSEIVSLVHHALIEEFRCDRIVVLIIDEAQNMPIQTLESLRMLGNIETEKHKLLQIVLAGQPELDQMLNSHELRQLKQRIAVKATINALTKQESREYILQHLRVVSRDQSPVFDEGAIRKIIAHAEGIPRAINIAADSALMHGYGAGVRPVTSGIVAEATGSLSAYGASSRPNYGRLIGSAALIIFVFALSIGILSRLPPGGLKKPRASQDIQDTVNLIATPEPTSPDRARSSSAEGAFDLTLAMGIENIPPLRLDFSPDDTNNYVGTSDDVSPLLPVATENPIPASDSEDINLGVKQGEPDSTAVAAPAAIDAARRLWDPEALPDDSFPMFRPVRSGDSVSSLCIDVYGFLSADLFEFLVAENEALKNPNDLEVGQTIRFPKLTEELQIVRSNYIKRKLRKRARMDVGRGDI